MDATRTAIRKILLEGFRGFISPDGEQVEIDPGADHGQAASGLLDTHHFGWNWEDDERFEDQGVIYATPALLSKGWLRIVDDGIYSVWELSGPALDHVTMEVSDLHPADKVILDVESTGDYVQTTAGDFLEKYA